MSTINVRISSTTRRGKYLQGLLLEMAKTGKDIEIESKPNAETIKAMNDANEGRASEVKRSCYSCVRCRRLLNGRNAPNMVGEMTKMKLPEALGTLNQKYFQA